MNKPFNFDKESQEISAMITCPRCSLPQEEAPQCEYCGLIFDEFVEPAQSSKTARPKRMALFVVILAAVCLLAAYGYNYSRQHPSQKSTNTENSSVREKSTKDDDLRKTARELTGDVGIVKGLTAGSTKGSIVAMVIFSIVGMGYLTYGKRSQQILMAVCGIVLMGYSYFVDGTVYIILIGVGLSALPFILGKN
jgi:hypothetical protein